MISAMSNPPKRKRPFGIKVIIVLELIYAAVLITTLVGILANIDWLIVLPQPSDILAIQLAIISILILFILVTVPGLWQLKHWAWVLLMVQIGVSLGNGLWAYFSGSPQYGNMAINVVIVFYLNQGDVRRAFSTPQPEGVKT